MDNLQLGVLEAELPRQLAIFRNASTAVIWLNDVTTWDNTRGAAAWLGLKLLETDTNVTRYQDLGDIKEALDIAAESALCSCDLALLEDTAPVGIEEQQISAPAWFTSLWTLQEITICPDMLFLDKEWRPLTIGSTLITLNSLGSLISAVGMLDNAPRGVATLISVNNNHLRSMGENTDSIL
jgi:hypothetical protein